MDYIRKMEEYVGTNIDSLTYMGIEGKKPKTYKISPLIDINWQEVLADPPKNTPVSSTMDRCDRIICSMTSCFPPTPKPQLIGRTFGRFCGQG